MVQALVQLQGPARSQTLHPTCVRVCVNPSSLHVVLLQNVFVASGLSCAGVGAGAAAGGSMLLERWTLCFSPGVNSSGNSRASMDTAAVYKRLVGHAP
jgi:hypothetical protein